MKIFISSVIRGFGPYRDAAAKAAKILRHKVTRSEDFGASPESPQQVCLAGVREADATVLILGAAYGGGQGDEQLSATHQEYREAREQTDVLVFKTRTLRCDQLATDRLELMSDYLPERGSRFREMDPS